MASGVCPDGDAACRTTVLYLGPAKLGDDFFEARYEAFQRDWTGVPDAVLADGESAFSFVRKYGEDLFGEAPVIYLGMARPDQALTSVLGRYSGVPLVEDVAGTLDLIFRLEPQTSLVVGVMDGTPESRALKASVEAAMEPYMDRAQIVFPGHEPGDDGGLDKEALASVASSVPQTGAVLFLGFGSDRDGKDVDEGDCVRLLAERSAGPVYVLTDRWLDRGALGGALALGRDQARAAVGLIPDKPESVVSIGNDIK